MTLLQRFFGKFLSRAPRPLPPSPIFPFPALSPTAVPRPLFRPPEIYIIVLSGSPLNRVAERDSAGALFRVDVDGRIGDLTNKRIEG